jgi:hypothetical protein
MRHTAGGFLLVAVSLAPIASRSAADVESSTARVIIRAYDGGSASPNDRPAALKVARGILEAAGLDVRWQVCDAGAALDDSGPCAQPLAANELSIRFVRWLPRADRAGRFTLGESVVDRETRAGQLATIYLDRTMGLARESGICVDTLLGRGIAHEVGHLLLGTTRHTRAGLMRAIWTKETLGRDEARDWLFSPAEGRTMRAALRARSARDDQGRSVQRAGGGAGGGGTAGPDVPPVPVIGEQ